MNWQPNEQIGAYRITDVLGSGGMATVYRAYHERLERDVAIKVMHKAFLSDADFHARFDREAKIVARLEHPHIVPVYDFSEIEGQPYLVLKYIQGDTLKDILTERPPTLSEIVRMTDALASALTYAHQQGVLHRDIKPSNVILDERGTVYLTDFGLARAVHAGESTLSAGMIVGTPNYVSPEQAEGKKELTEQSDVYSLGVMLYEMVVGRLPFQGKNPYSTIHMHIYEEPPLPSEVNPEIPVEVEMVLLRALEKDPQRRYPTPDALAEAFKQAVAQSGLTTLSEDRSGVFRAEPASARTTPMIEKPKNTPREDPFNSGLLLLEDEESWAKLPREEIARRRLKKRRDERVGLIGHAVPYVLVNALIVGGSLADGNFSLGALIPALGWGAGLAAHAINVQYHERQKVEELYQDYENHMTEWHGADWRNTVPEVDIYREWRQAQERFEASKGFAIHAAVYFMINLLIWTTWLIATLESGNFIFPYPLIVMGGWGIGLFSNWMEVRSNNGTVENSERVLAELEMMEGASLNVPRKRKNKLDDDVRLTEDGEFTDSTVDQLNRRR